MVDRERDVVGTNIERETREEGSDFQEFDRDGEELYEEGHHQFGLSSHRSPSSSSNLNSQGHRGNALT